MPTADSRFAVPCPSARNALRNPPRQHVPTVVCNFKKTRMTAKEWILQLEQDDILTKGTKNDQQYLHLKTPCKIHLTENATKQLRDNYDTKNEKGGFLVAKPQKVGDITDLTIDKIIFLKNISDTPHNSYLPDEKELNQALDKILFGQGEKNLPIRFHTHPTHSNNPINELFQYIYQSNTSKQDQIVSDIPVLIDDINLLMPRSLF